MNKFVLENGRPDKPVPCPRCHSLNTKFCYFNNYNVKQPRHFCRECQRYWTAGGSLRNVPVGAGRRKHKIAASATKLNGGDSDECVYISPMKPYPSLPLKRVATSSPNGNILQGAMGMQGNDLMSICGSNKAFLSQILQKSSFEATQNMSLETDGRRCESMVLPPTPRSLQHPGDLLQKSARNAAVEAKAIHGHEVMTSRRLCEHVDACQNEMQSDAGGKCESDLRPSATNSLPETISTTEQSDSTTPQDSSASEVPLDPSGGSPTAHNLPLASESTSAFWSPLMWPWMWPFFVNGANAPNLAAGFGGALAASVAPHVQQAAGANGSSCIDTARISALGPSFSHWPYAWNTLPWGSPWCIAWNAHDNGHTLSSQEPEKEKQGLLCVPKTLRMDHPDEGAYSSILKTLGVTARPQSGFLNTFQPKAEVFQPKFVASKAVEHSELHRHPLPHLNPAAHARSVAFQEGS